MKKIVLIALASVMAFSLAACGTIKEKAKQAVKAKLEEAANKSGTDSETPSETQSEAAAEKEPEREKDPHDWMKGDFKVEFDYAMGTAVSAGMGTSGGSASTADEHSIVSRVGDTVYVYKRNGAAEANNLYRMEDGKVVRYLFNPKNKKALRTVSSVKSIDAGVENMFKEHLGARPPTKNLEKTGTDTVAGVKCDVYEENTAVDDKLGGMGALAGLLGDKGGQLKELMKSTNTTTWFVAQGGRFVARKHVKMTMAGKESEFDFWNVVYFKEGGISPKEVDYDMSQYAITQGK